MNKKELLIVPYVYQDGVPTFRDSGLKELYHRTKEDGLLPIVFYNQDTMTFQEDEFVRMFKSPDVFLFVIFLEGEPCGYSWLTDIADRRAQGSFCFFKKFQGDLVEIGKQVLQFMLNLNDRFQQPCLDVIYGLTPVTNPRAAAWIQKIGMTILGTIPKACWHHEKGCSVDAAVSFIERKE